MRFLPSSFVEEVKPEAYSKAIRNLMLGAVLLNVPLLLLLSLSLPPSILYTETNLLSHLAGTSRYAPRFLEILTVVDAVTVLCGGVLCGGVSCCSLVDRLSGDGILPRWVAWKSRWTRNTSVGGIGVYLALCVGQSSLQVWATSRVLTRGRFPFSCQSSTPRPASRSRPSPTYFRFRSRA